MMGQGRCRVALGSSCCRCYCCCLHTGSRQGEPGGDTAAAAVLCVLLHVLRDRVGLLPISNASLAFHDSRTLACMGACWLTLRQLLLLLLPTHTGDRTMLDEDAAKMQVFSGQCFYCTIHIG